MTEIWLFCCLYCQFWIACFPRKLVDFQISNFWLRFQRMCCFWGEEVTVFVFKWCFNIHSIVWLAAFPSVIKQTAIEVVVIFMVVDINYLNLFVFISTAERQRPYLMTRVQGTNDYINAAFLDVSNLSFNFVHFFRKQLPNIFSCNVKKAMYIFRIFGRDIT